MTPDIKFAITVFIIIGALALFLGDAINLVQQIAISVCALLWQRYSKTKYS